MWMFKRKISIENQCDTVQEKLLASSAAFIDLYSRHQDDLLRTSEKLTRLAVQAHEKQKASKKDKTVQALFGAFTGAALGATFGAITGGAGGAFGAVGAATFNRFCCDINAAGATIGVVGSVIGGTVGGTFSGALGGAIGAATEAAGHPVQCVAYDLAWGTIGCAAGTAIGGIFGGTVGAAGGGIGGAFGGLFGMSVAVGAVRQVTCNVKEIEQQREEIREVKILQKAVKDFQETIKPLVEELNIIRATSNKSSVAGQSAKTLAAVTVMDKVLGGIRTTKDKAETVSWIEEVARKCTEITEELKKMKAEVEKLSASLRKW